MGLPLCSNPGRDRGCYAIQRAVLELEDLDFPGLGFGGECDGAEGVEGGLDGVGCCGERDSVYKALVFERRVVECQDGLCFGLLLRLHEPGLCDGMAGDDETPASDEEDEPPREEVCGDE